MIAGPRTTAVCTGTLIGPSTVVTAAHCVVQDIPGRVMASSVRFAAGHYSGTTAPYGWANHVALYVASEYFTSPLVRQYDVAVIVLDRPVGRTAGTMGFMTAPSYIGPLQNGQVSKVGGASCGINPHLACCVCALRITLLHHSAAACPFAVPRRQDASRPLLLAGRQAQLQLHSHGGQGAVCESHL